MESKGQLAIKEESILLDSLNFIGSSQKDEYISFGGTSEAVGCFRMKSNISFPAPGCRKLGEVDDERKLYTFYKKRMVTEVAADALVKNGRVTWFESVVGTTNKVSP